MKIMKEVALKRYGMNMKIMKGVALKRCGWNMKILKGVDLKKCGRNKYEDYDGSGSEGEYSMVEYFQI